MSEAVRQESPLVERVTAARQRASPADPGLTLREHAFLGCVNLRGDPEDTQFLEAVKAVLAVDLPVEPNTIAASKDVMAFWLAPTEWLLRTGVGGERDLILRLEQALEGMHVATNDVTSHYTTLELTGPRTRHVLEKGCVLDLHRRHFRPGECAQTLLSHAGILIRPLEDERGFELVVRRSFADYVFVWLEDAAAEYGMAVAD